MPRQILIPILFAGAIAIVAASAGAPASANDEVHTTPSANEMSPAEWRRLQLIAADQSDRIMHDAEKQPGLLAQYVHMKSHYDTNHERAFQLIFGQYLSWYQTFVGDYTGAAASFSIAQPPQPDDGPSPSTGDYRARPAADVILEMAKSRKAVFFNEAHSAPITRTLTIELLAKLRAQGFDYFAAETLYSNDPDLQQRGYPTPKSGFYIDEPLYGEMVRTALKLGYKVIAYDVENAGAGDARERAGAERLAQVFKRDANARLIVDAGFAHVQKSGKYLGGSSMGEFFRKISGIDPLTIEQTMLIQHARRDQDHPYYLAAMQALHPRKPIVFVSTGGKAWTLKPDKYDMSVVFPQTEDSRVRPDWLSLGGLRVAYPISGDLCNRKFPCLVEAQYAGEGDDAVAADRAILDVIDLNAPANQRIVSGHEDVHSRLFLRPGKYRLRATDRENHTVSASDIVVEAARQANP